MPIVPSALLARPVHRKLTFRLWLEKWFLRVRDVSSHGFAQWNGWDVITTHMGLLDQTITLGVKQRRDGVPYGAYVLITEMAWDGLTAWDKLAILRILRDCAKLLPEAREIEDTKIIFTEQGWGAYPHEEVRLR